jgi:glycosyltransferase involved in cell wall biosynthesis
MSSISGARPFCSFIVAVYDREQYVAQAMRSILSQSCPDFEVIVVNDGSMDGSDKVIKSFQDFRIRYFDRSHTGCWATKNFAIEQATGRFLCFIDSDDFISKDYLEIAKKQIQKTPLYDYYYPTIMAIVKADGELTTERWRYISFPVSERHRLIRLFWEHQIGGIPHAAAFISREVFERCGLYDDTFYNLSDTAYIISHAMEIRFFLIPELLTYHNRQHPQQTCSNFSERMRTYAEIVTDIIQRYPTGYFLDTEINKDTASFYQICVTKFMELAGKTEYNEHFLNKANQYLKMLRSVE